MLCKAILILFYILFLYNFFTFFFTCMFIAPGHYHPENYNPEHSPAFTFGHKTLVMPGKWEDTTTICHPKSYTILWRLNMLVRSTIEYSFLSLSFPFSIFLNSFVNIFYIFCSLFFFILSCVSVFCMFVVLCFVPVFAYLSSFATWTLCWRSYHTETWKTYEKSW